MGAGLPAETPTPAESSQTMHNHLSALQQLQLQRGRVILSRTGVRARTASGSSLPVAPLGTARGLTNASSAHAGSSAPSQGNTPVSDYQTATAPLYNVFQTLHHATPSATGAAPSLSGVPGTPKLQPLRKTPPPALYATEGLTGVPSGTTYLRGFLTWVVCALVGWLSIPSQFMPLFTHAAGLGFFLTIVTQQTRWLYAVFAGTLSVYFMFMLTVPEEWASLSAHSTGFISMIVAYFLAVYFFAKGRKDALPMLSLLEILQKLEDDCLEAAPPGEVPPLSWHIRLRKWIFRKFVQSGAWLCRAAAPASSSSRFSLFSFGLAPSGPAIGTKKDLHGAEDQFGNKVVIPDMSKGQPLLSSSDPGYAALASRMRPTPGASGPLDNAPPQVRALFDSLVKLVNRLTGEDPETSTFDEAKRGEDALPDQIPHLDANQEAATNASSYLREDTRPQLSAIPDSESRSVHAATTDIEASWRHILLGLDTPELLRAKAEIAAAYRAAAAATQVVKALCLDSFAESNPAGTASRTSQSKHGLNAFDIMRASRLALGEANTPEALQTQQALQAKLGKSQFISQNLPRTQGMAGLGADSSPVSQSVLYETIRATAVLLQNTSAVYQRAYEFIEIESQELSLSQLAVQALRSRLLQQHRQILRLQQSILDLESRNQTQTSDSDMQLAANCATNNTTDTSSEIPIEGTLRGGLYVDSLATVTTKPTRSASVSSQSSSSTIPSLGMRSRASSTVPQAINEICSDTSESTVPIIPYRPFSFRSLPTNVAPASVLPDVSTTAESSGSSATANDSRQELDGLLEAPQLPPLPAYVDSETVYDLLARERRAGAAALVAAERKTHDLVNSLRAELDSQRQAFRECQQLASEKVKELDQTQKSLEALRKELSRLKQDRERAYQSKDTALQDRYRLETEVARLTQSNDQLKQELRERDSQLQQISSQNAKELQKRKNDYEQKLKEWETRNSDLSEKLNQARREAEGLKKDVCYLRDEISRLQTDVETRISKAQSKAKAEAEAELSECIRKAVQERENQFEQDHIRETANRERTIASLRNQLQRQQEAFAEAKTALELSKTHADAQINQMAAMMRTLQARVVELEQLNEAQARQLHQLQMQLSQVLSYSGPTSHASNLQGSQVTAGSHLLGSSNFQQPILSQPLRQHGGMTGSEWSHGFTSNHVTGVENGLVGGNVPSVAATPTSHTSAPASPSLTYMTHSTMPVPPLSSTTNSRFYPPLPTSVSEMTLLQSSLPESLQNNRTHSAAQDVLEGQGESSLGASMDRFQNAVGSDHHSFVSYDNSSLNSTGILVSSFAGLTASQQNTSIVGPTDTTNATAATPQSEDATQTYSVLGSSLMLPRRATSEDVLTPNDNPLASIFARNQESGALRTLAFE